MARVGGVEPPDFSFGDWAVIRHSPASPIVLRLGWEIQFT